MGKGTTEIEEHIARTRQDLSANLHELETRVKEAADIDRQVIKRPLAFTGLAFGVGIVMAALLKRRL